MTSRTFMARKANMDTMKYVWALVILITIPSITTISILYPYHYLEIALLVYYDQESCEYLCMIRVITLVFDL